MSGLGGEVRNREAPVEGVDRQVVNEEGVACEGRSHTHGYAVARAIIVVEIEVVEMVVAAAEAATLNHIDGVERYKGAVLHYANLEDEVGRTGGAGPITHLQTADVVHLRQGYYLGLGVVAFKFIVTAAGVGVGAVYINAGEGAAVACAAGNHAPAVGLCAVLTLKAGAVRYRHNTAGSGSHYCGSKRSIGGGAVGHDAKGISGDWVQTADGVAGCSHTSGNHCAVAHVIHRVGGAAVE